MKITVTSTATSFYSLALAGLQANHSMTLQQATDYLSNLENSSGFQADLYVASGTIYYDRGLTATSTTAIPVWAGITRLTVDWLTELSLVAWSNTDVLVAIDWIF